MSHASTLPFEPQSLEERVLWELPSRGAKPLKRRVFEPIVELGYRLGFGDPADSITLSRQESERELEWARRSAKLMAAKLSVAESAVDPDRRASAFRELGILPKRVLQVLLQHESWREISALRRPLRVYWENVGGWKNAAIVGTLCYERAAKETNGVAELPWIQVRDVAWFAALSNNAPLAQASANEALRTFERVKGANARIGAAHAHRVLGLVALHEDAPHASERAIQEFTAAYDHASSADHRELAIRVQLHLAAARLRSRDIEKAGAILDDAIKGAYELQNPYLIIVSLLKRAEYSQASGKFEAATNDLMLILYASEGNALYEFGKASLMLSQLQLNSAQDGKDGAENVELLVRALWFAREAHKAFQAVQAGQEQAAKLKMDEISERLLRTGERVDSAEFARYAFPLFGKA